jgi:hypothetical protein
MQEKREQKGKPRRDPIDITHFTEKVSAKIHGLPDQAETYRTLREEFAKSKQYRVSLLLLTDNGAKFRLTEAGFPAGELEAAQRTVGVRAKRHSIDLNKSSMFSQVVGEGKTVEVKVSDIIAELFPQRLATSISNSLGAENRACILTPLRQHGNITGAFGISSTELAEPFIPSVVNLAQHVSNALELADEYGARKRPRKDYEKFTRS